MPSHAVHLQGPWLGPLPVGQGAELASRPGGLWEGTLVGAEKGYRREPGQKRAEVSGRLWDTSSRPVPGALLEKQLPTLGESWAGQAPGLVCGLASSGAGPGAAYIGWVWLRGSWPVRGPAGQDSSVSSQASHQGGVRGSGVVSKVLESS